MTHDRTTEEARRAGYLEPTKVKIVGKDGVVSHVLIENQAVAKAVEERLRGLSSEEPLEDDTRRDGRGGVYVGGSFRNPLTSFTPEFLRRHEREIMEIWTVHQKNTGALNYGNILANLEARGGKTYQDAVAEYTDMEKRYNAWRKLCPDSPRNACINVFGRGMNFKWAAMDSGDARGAIKKLCERGLKIYTKVRHV